MDAYTLKNLFSDLDHFQRVMGEAASSLSRPEEKHMVQQLLGQLSQARAEAEKEIPQILEKKLKSAQAAQAECEGLLQQVEQAEKNLQEQLRAAASAAASPPAPPALPEVSIDPAHGERLLNELLDRYVGPQPTPVEPHDPADDLWQAMLRKER